MSLCLTLVSKLCDYDAMMNILSQSKLEESNKRKLSKIKEKEKSNVTYAKNINMLRPTVVLRVETDDGFSVIVRALLDTGATRSSMKSHLVQLLLTNGNVQKVNALNIVFLNNNGLIG